MKRFNASKVKRLGNLAPTCEKAKRFNRKLNGVKSRFAVERETKPYDAAKRAENADKSKCLPVKSSHVFRFHNGKSRSGCRLHPAIREALKMREQAREMFFKG